MKKLFYLLFASLLLQSCFEIVEEVSLNKDGSGHFKYTVNFSQSASKIHALLEEDEIDGFKVPTLQKIERDFKNYTSKSTRIVGLSNCKEELDLEHFIFIFECDFSDVKSLNSFTDSLRSMHDSEFTAANYFEYNETNKIFKRTGDDLIEKLNQKMTTSQRMIFNGASYTCLYRFFDEISERVPSGINLSVNKRNTFHRLSMSAMIWNGKLINQEITLK